MTNPHLTEIIAILDRSGSMGRLQMETIHGFNAFVEEQRRAPGEAKLTLVQFDDEYQIDYQGVDVNEAPSLSVETYKPRGWTALNDAIGRTVVAVGERLAATPEDERPAQVIVLIITDGAENASKDWDVGRVAAAIKEQTEVYNWRFVFMGGGDLDTQKKAAQGLGIHANNAYAYGNNAAGVNAVYSSAAAGVSRSRDAASRGLVAKSTDALLTDDERAGLESTSLLD